MSFIFDVWHRDPPSIHSFYSNLKCINSYILYCSYIRLYAMDKIIKVCEIFTDKIGLLNQSYYFIMWIIQILYRLIGKTNANSCDFGCCDSSTLVNICGIM